MIRHRFPCLSPNLDIYPYCLTGFFTHFIFAEKSIAKIISDMEKSVVKKILINVMLLLFVAVNGSAQFITGSITDRQGLPVEFANIVLLSVPDSSFLQGTVSDESGRFSHSNRRFYIYTNLCDQSYLRSVTTIYRDITSR